MPHSSVAQWKTILECLQNLPQQPTRGADLQIGTELVKFSKATVPKSAWKQLINELKVPKHLGKACCSLPLDMSSSWHASPAWQCLSQFLSRAFDDLIQVREGRAIPSGKVLVSSITQQLHQCDLLGRFPDLLLAAAKLLNSADPAAAAAAAAAAGTGAKEFPPFSYPISLDVCRSLLQVSQNLVHFVPPGKPVQAHPCSIITAAASLALAAMRLISRAVAVLPANWLAEKTKHSHLAGELLTVSLYIAEVVGEPGSGDMLNSADVLTLLSVLPFMLYISMLLPDSACRPVWNSSSGGGSSSSGPAASAGSGGAWVSAAMAFVANLAYSQDMRQFHGMAGLKPELDDQQQQQNGSQCFDPCLWATGVSMQGAAYLAACLNRSSPPEGMCSTLVGLYAAVNHPLAAAATDASPQECGDTQQQQQQEEEEEDEEEEEGAEKESRVTQQEQQGRAREPVPTSLLQHMCRNVLLAQVLLCTLLRDSSSTSSIASYRHRSGVTNCTAVAHVAQQVISGILTYCKAVGQELLGEGLLMTWLGAVLPVVGELLADMRLRLVGHAAATSTTTSSSSVGSGSSGGGSSGIDRQSVMEGMVRPLLQLLTAASEHTVKLAAEQGVDDHLAAYGKWDAMQHWQQSSLQLCSGLEGLLRAQAPAAAGLAVVNWDTAVELTATAADLTLLTSPLCAAVQCAGPGSKEQQQLFSLLCSILKICGYVRASIPFGTVSETAAEGADNLYLQVVLKAAPLLLSEAVLTAAPATAGRATDGLPWLVLVGRCCFAWAAQLQQLQASRPRLGQLLLQARGMSAQARAELLQIHAAHAAEVVIVYDAQSVPTGWVSLKGCKTWVQGRVGDLTAAGYPVEAVLQQLRATMAALEAPAAAADADAAAAAYGDLVLQLQSLGFALSSLAVPHACNNPACSNMAGPTELAAVSAQSNICGSCLIARYCSRVCQKQHWKQHKTVCKALAAAASAAVERLACC